MKLRAKEVKLLRNFFDTNENMGSKISALLEEQKVLELERNEYEATIKENKTTLDALESKNRDLQKKNMELMADKSGLEIEKETANTSLKSLTGEHKQLQESTGALSKQLEDAQAALTSTKEENEAQSTTIKEKSKELGEAVETIEKEKKAKNKFGHNLKEYLKLQLTETFIVNQINSQEQLADFVT